MGRGRTVTSEPDVEDRGMAFISEAVIRDGCFISRVESDAGSKKTSGRASVLPPFERPPRASPSGLVWAASVIELSASESLENSVSGIEVSVSVDPWLGGRPMVNGKLKLVRGLEG